MSNLRLILPLLAGLLACVLFVEATDLVRCADEREANTAAHDERGDAHDERGDAHDDGANGHHGPVNDSHRSEHLPDCLCHVVFVPTALPPEVGAPVELEFLYAASASSVLEVEIAPPGHVPIG